MVVGDRDPDQRSPCPAGEHGRTATTRPPVGVGPAVQVPPSSAARSRIEVRPTPGGHGPCGGAVVDDGQPDRGVDGQLDADGAGVARGGPRSSGASVAIRYAATSTAAGSAGIGVAASTATVTVHRRAGPRAARPAAKRAGQAELVERRWAQPVHHAPHVIDRVADVTARSSASSAAACSGVLAPAGCATASSLERPPGQRRGRGRRAGRGAAGGVPPPGPGHDPLPGRPAPPRRARPTRSAARAGRPAAPARRRSAAASRRLAAAHAHHQLADRVSARSAAAPRARCAGRVPDVDELPPRGRSAANGSRSASAERVQDRRRSAPSPASQPSPTRDMASTGSAR